MVSLTAKLRSLKFAKLHSLEVSFQSKDKINAKFSLTQLSSPFVLVLECQ